VAGLLLIQAGPAVGADFGPPLMQGVSLHGPLTWGKTDPDRTGYAWPVYDGSAYEVPVELLRKVKAAGFDFVRLTVDPGPLLAFRGVERDGLDRRIVDVVGQIRSTGLDVLVDFHPIRMIGRYTAEHLESEWPGGLFSAYVEMVRRSTRLLAHLDTKHIAIEPMNEPQHGYTLISRWRWQGMMERLYGAVRTEAPDMTVIVTGGHGGDIDGLVQLDPRPFSQGDVRFSFHYYQPYVFTAEGAVDSHWRTQPFTYTAGLPYPASPADSERSWQVVSRRVQASNLTSAEKAAILSQSRTLLADYFHGGGARGRIRTEFDRVTEWMRRYNLYSGQIFMGEFGATRKGPMNDGARPDDRARWLSDVRQEAEARGFHWSMWTLCDDAHGRAARGMTLVSVTDRNQIDRLTARALGLSPR
jgi:endoglucanase